MVIDLTLGTYRLFKVELQDILGSLEVGWQNIPDFAKLPYRNYDTKYKNVF